MLAQVTLGLEFRARYLEMPLEVGYREVGIEVAGKHARGGHLVGLESELAGCRGGCARDPVAVAGHAGGACCGSEGRDGESCQEELIHGMQGFD